MAAMSLARSISWLPSANEGDYVTRADSTTRDPVPVVIWHPTPTRQYSLSLQDILHLYIKTFYISSSFINHHYSIIVLHYHYYPFTFYISSSIIITQLLFSIIIITRLLFSIIFNRSCPPKAFFTRDLESCPPRPFPCFQVPVAIETTYQP